MKVLFHTGYRKTKELSICLLFDFMFSCQILIINEDPNFCSPLAVQSLDGRAIRVNVAEERPRRGSF